MSKLLLPTTLIAMLMSVPATAQEAEQQPPQFVYNAYFKIGFAHMQEWTSIYQQHTVPILTQLQEEGIIQGWATWQHQTGGEYNWLMAVRTWDWAAFDTFWESYLSRLPAEVLAATGKMIAAHYDEIWDITQIHFPERTVETSYLYSSSYQVSFADMDAWNEAWAQHVAPVLNQAMTDGLLGAWVVLGHNTGGRHNWRVLYFFEQWDNMDDFFQRVSAAVLGDPQVWEQIGGMVVSHEDYIWVPVPRQGEM